MPVDKELLEILACPETKEAVAESLKGHPHFMMPDGFIDVVELMPIPGM